MKEEQIVSVEDKELELLKGQIDDLYAREFARTNFGDYEAARELSKEKDVCAAIGDSGLSGTVTAIDIIVYTRPAPQSLDTRHTTL